MKLSCENPVSRQNHNVSLNAQADSKRKMISYLETTLKQEIEKREEAERNLLQYRQRSLRAQNEFSRLLQKYDNNIAIIKGKESYSQQIWNRLIDEIQVFNENSEQILEKRCNEILCMMNRKINQILEKTDFEIKKTKKLSEEEYKNVKEQIKEALSLAKEIQHENDAIKKMNKELTFKVNILREEKSLLIEELNQKKMVINKLTKQAFLDKAPRSTSIMSPRPRSTRATTSEVKPPKFMCEPSIRVSIEDPEIDLRVKQKKDRSMMMVKTDNHFKICLEREKRKNSELKGLVNKLQFKCKDVNSLIERSFQEVDQLGSEQNRQKRLRHLIEEMKIKMVLPNGGRDVNAGQREILDLIKY